MNFTAFKQAFEINLHGTLYCSAICAYYMSKNKEEEKGVIINVSSHAAWDANRTQIAYGSSKSAVNSLTFTMA